MPKTKNIRKFSFQFAKTNFRPKINLKKAQKSLKLRFSAFLTVSTGTKNSTLKMAAQNYNQNITKKSCFPYKILHYHNFFYDKNCSCSK